MGARFDSSGGSYNLSSFTHDAVSTDAGSYSQSDNETRIGTDYSYSRSSSGAGDQSANIHLHQEGTYSDGAINLSSYLYDYVGSYGSSDISSSSSTSPGYSSTNSSSSTVERTTTLHEEGTYSSAAWNLSCYVYDDVQAIDYAGSDSSSSSSSGGIRTHTTIMSIYSPVARWTLCSSTIPHRSS